MQAQKECLKCLNNLSLLAIDLSLAKNPQLILKNPLLKKTIFHLLEKKSVQKRFLLQFLPKSIIKSRN